MKNKKNPKRKSVDRFHNLKKHELPIRKPFMVSSEEEGKPIEQIAPVVEEVPQQAPAVPPEKKSAPEPTITPKQEKPGKKTYLIFAIALAILLLIIISLARCSRKSPQPVPTTTEQTARVKQEPTKEATTPAITQPKAEAKTSTPVQETKGTQPAIEQPKKETATSAPVQETKAVITQGNGYAIQATDHEAVITTSYAVTKAQADGFVSYLAAQHPAEAKLCTLTYHDDGTATLTYPSTDKADRGKAIALIAKDLDAYLMQNEITTPEQEEKTLTAEGYGLSVSATGTEATITSKQAVTKEQADSLLSYLASRHPDEAKYCSVTYNDDHTATLSYPLTSTADRQNAIDILSKDLEDYLTVAEVVTTAPVAEKPLTAEGYGLSVSATETEATITSKQAVTKEQADSLLSYLASRHPDEAEYCSVTYNNDHTATLHYPITSTADRQNAIIILSRDLGDYLTVGNVTTTTPAEAQASKEETTPAEEKPLTAEGYGLSVSSTGMEATITSKQAVTKEQADSLLSYLALRHPKEAQYCSVTYNDDHTATLSYPLTSTADRKDAINILSKDMEDYLTVAEVTTETPTMEKGTALTATYANYGISLNVTSAETDASVTASDNVTADDATAFVTWLCARYPNETKACSLSYSGDGNAMVTYPATGKEARIGYLNALGTALDEYLAPKEKMVAQKQETKTSVKKETTVGTKTETIKEQPKKQKREFRNFKQSLLLSVSPYGWEYVDFYNGRNAIIHAGISLKEFMSYYGYGFDLEYQYRVLPFLSVGAEASCDIYYLQRSILTTGTQYLQVLAQGKCTFHQDVGNFGFFEGLALGIDFSNLRSTGHVYFAGGIQLGVTWRFADHWSLLYKATANLSLQPKSEDPLYSSITYTIVPAYLGVIFQF